MRPSLWNDAEARKWTSSAKNEADQLVAQRVYSSRIIGADPDLVMHGGGKDRKSVV